MCAIYWVILVILISNVNNAQIDNTKDIDIVMPIYNLIEYW